MKFLQFSGISYHLLVLQSLHLGPYPAKRVNPSKVKTFLSLLQNKGLCTTVEVSVRCCSRHLGLAPRYYQYYSPTYTNVTPYTTHLYFVLWTKLLSSCRALHPPHLTKVSSPSLWPLVTLQDLIISINLMLSQMAVHCLRDIYISLRELPPIRTLLLRTLLDSL